MAKAKIADAWIQVALSMEGIEKQLEQDLKKAFNKTGAKAGRELGEEVGSEAGETLGTELEKKGGKSTSNAMRSMGKLAIAGVAAWGLTAAISSAISAGFEQQNSLNITAAGLNLNEGEIEKVAEASSSLFTQAYGESYEQIQETMRAIVGSVAGARNASADELETMGKDVLNLSTAYGVSSEQLLRGVQSQLTSGLASNWDEAISNILGGFQTMGANGNDFFETLTEYSDDFTSLGLNGAESISLVNAALEAGVRNTDVFADALQEFQIRLGDTSSHEALTSLGFDPVAIQAEISKGGDSAQAALETVWTKLQETGNRDLFGQVFGTQAEDYFTAFNTIDLSSLNDGLTEGVGNMEKFNETLNAGANVSLESFNRLVQQTFVELLQPVLEAVTPLLSEFATFLAENEGAAAALAVIIGGVMLVAVVALTAALWAMVAPVLANPITWIILAAVVAVGLLIAAIFAIAANWDAIVAHISTLWAGFIEWFTGGLNAIGDFFGGLMQGLGNFFIGWVNMIISGINMILAGINTIQFDLPDWLGGYTIGFNFGMIPELPKLAKGGTVLPTQGGTAAILAEAGKAETVIDAGLANAAIEQGLIPAGGGGAMAPIINVYQQPGESTEELVTRMTDYLEFNSVASTGGYTYGT